MSCAEGLGAALALRAMWTEIAYPRQDLRKQEIARTIPISAVTDCTSLYDNIHRDGAFKAPSEKRLIMDLAAIREMLGQECPVLRLPGRAETGKPRESLPLLWIPTQHMLADALTKPMSGEKLRAAVRIGEVNPWGV
jgi:hypothetical protein